MVLRVGLESAFQTFQNYSVGWPMSESDRSCLKVTHLPWVAYLKKIQWAWWLVPFI